MLTLQDCLALSELTEDEVAAIAAHEHCHEMIAAELGHYLVETPGGRLRIKAMIQDDLAAAAKAGDLTRTSLLKSVLKHFVATHGDARPDR